jgi:uncharacterized protein (UPF0335 family)
MYFDNFRAKDKQYEEEGEALEREIEDLLQRAKGCGQEILSMQSCITEMQQQVIQLNAE